MINSPEKVEAAAERIAERGALVPAGSTIAVHEKVGGMEIATVENMIEVSKFLARAGVGVPPHCRDNPGTVFAICMQAQEWGLPYMAVINKSYVTKGKGGVERLAYEAQLVHTLIETRANLTGKLRDEYIGEGDDMICRVSGTFKGETEPHTWDSEKLGDIRKNIGKNDQGQFKGSPLWITKPKVQLHYSTTRDWARVHCPWVILGVYTPEEMEETVIRDVTPETTTSLVERLKAARREGARGFDPDHVERTIGDTNSGAATEEASDGSEDEGGSTARRNSAATRRDDGSVEGGGDGNNEGSGAGTQPAVGGVGGDDAGSGSEAEAQQEPIPPEPKRKPRK